MLSSLALSAAVAAIGGFHPLACVWACAAPWLLTLDPSPSQVYAVAVAMYAVHGLAIECWPFGRPLDSARPGPSLSLREVLPCAFLNLASAAALLPLVSWDPRRATAVEALAHMLVAVLGNEIVYAPVHCLLHTPAFYLRFHAKHHRLTRPRALGAAYCSIAEMWLANLPSLLLPLACTDPPSAVWLLWIGSAVIGTQVHHSGASWALNFGHQPMYHDAHHRLKLSHYGNLGFLERPLQLATTGRVVQAGRGCPPIRKG